MAGFDHDVIVVGSGGDSRRTAANRFTHNQGKPLVFGVEGSATA